MKGSRVLTAAAIVMLILGAPLTEAAAKKIKNCGPITQPGAYELKKNLTATGDCLRVQANYVTIDLGGHTITGNGTGDGITDGGAARLGIVVRNGAITNFQRGTALGSSNYSRVERMRVIGNNGNGIVAGTDSTVIYNNASGNGVDGIRTGCGSTISGNVASGNTGVGIAADCACTLTDNTAELNTQDGITANAGSTFRGNAARQNGGIGIGANAGCTLHGNSSWNNTGDGIFVNTGSTVGDNTSTDNGGDGIEANCPSNVIGNTTRNNSGTNLNFVGGGCSNVNNIP